MSMCAVCNKEEEGKRMAKQKDKLKMFKEQQGVCVGKTSISLFELAKMHIHDAMEEKEDSHMIKHWKLSST